MQSKFITEYITKYIRYKPKNLVTRLVNVEGHNP